MRALRLLVLVQPLRRRRRRAASTRRAAFNPVTPYAESKVRAERDVAAARRRQLLPDLPAQRDGLRRLAAAARRPRGQQPRRLRVHHRRGAASRATARRGGRSSTSRTSPARSSPCSRRRASSSTTRPSTSAQTEENYQVRDVAEIVARGRPGSVVDFADGAGPDPRNYRVDFAKLDAVAARLPAAVDACARASRSSTTPTAASA